MQKKSFVKTILPLFILFIVIDAAILYWQQALPNVNPSPLHIFILNCLLFVLSIVSISMQLKSLDQKRAGAVVNSVLGGTMLKIFILAIVAFIYIYTATNKNYSYTIFTSMFLYMVYAAFEIRVSLKLNKKK